MTIKMIGGMWRRINGSDVRSFATYQEAVENKKALEDMGPLTPTDDVLQQLQK